MVKLINFVLLVVACVALVSTNPNLDAHRKTVIQADATAQTNSPTLGRIAGDVLADVNAVPLKYDNYYFFSTTHLNGNTASFGAFGHVWKMN